MKIAIAGTGYVAFVAGACLADLGSHVFCLDLVQIKIDLLNHGSMQFIARAGRRSHNRAIA